MPASSFVCAPVLASHAPSEGEARDRAAVVAQFRRLVSGVGRAELVETCVQLYEALLEAESATGPRQSAPTARPTRRLEAEARERRRA